MEKFGNIYIEGKPSIESLMKWLRDNKCPNCDHNTVYFNEGLDIQFFCIISLQSVNDVPKGLQLEFDEDGIDVEGMRYINTTWGHDILIDGYYYYTTI